MNDKKIIFLKDFQKELEPLPDGANVYVVSRNRANMGIAPSHAGEERYVFKVFTDKAMATLWTTTQPDPFGFLIEGHHVYREGGNELTFLEKIGHGARH